MEAAQFDRLARTAADRGRRHLLKAIGASGVAGLVTVVGAKSTDAKQGSRKKKTNKGKPSAEKAKPNDCCASCPPTGNPCVAAVRDASTDTCVQVLIVPGTECGANSICFQSGNCVACDDPRLGADGKRCPVQGPDDATFIGGFKCVSTDSDPNNCGDCGITCPSENCVDGQCA